jgi:DNA-binding response OmpR family regulator
LIVSILRELGVVGDICGNTRELAEQMRRGAGLAIIADEALQADDLRPIAEFRETQGAWSDLPVILLTHRGGLAAPAPELQAFAEVLGNVNFLERPFHPAILASMVRAAARNRHRQYEARARHEEIAERENQLQTALKAGRLGSWAFDVQTLQLQTSDTSRGHFGRAPGAPFEYDDLLQAIHPEDRKARTVVTNRKVRKKRGDEGPRKRNGFLPTGSGVRSAARNW